MIFLADGRLVTLAEGVAWEIARFAAFPETALEAGGILLGNYRGPHVEIVHCTAPMPQDTRTRFGFVRRDPGHQRTALEAWKASGRTVHFVGEWHTHPEDRPMPSHIDRNTWADLMRKRSSDAMIFLIAGRAAIYCGMGQDNRILTMTPVA